MISWLQSLDVSIFRFVNLSLSNPFFDKLMPFVSDPPYFAAVLIVVLVLLLWKGGPRARIFAVMLLLGIFLGDWLICDTIKHSVQRLRPFHRILDAHLRVGLGDSFSMPSSHAANWFCAMMITFVYYRRSLRFMLPVALLVCLSRIYNGVHYPSDVLAGAVLGSGYSLGLLWTLDALWKWAGPRWFPLWHERLPSLMEPELRNQSAIRIPHSAIDQHWLRLGYILVAFICLLRLGYLAAGKIELSEDEAYQWLWSKHMAISYYSKPPLIACVQFLGTHIWGDTEFGIRFFSPLIAAVMAVMLLRFMTRVSSGRTAFLLFVIVSATPILSLGAILMTIDPLSVLFWIAAMLAGWRAAQPDGATRQWLWVGLWMGLGFLSKYTNLFQLLCWLVFFLLWPPARKHLRRPGPYLALLIVIISLTPVIIWNCQHGWVTIQHVASDGQIGQPWHRTYTVEFLLQEAGLLNPFFFFGMVWAAIAFWRTDRRNPLLLYFFSMGAPLFLFFFLYSFHSRVLANWIAPSIVPLFCLMAVYWSLHWRSVLKPWLGMGIGLGVFAVVVAHDTNLLTKILHRQLPPKFDLLHRVRGWKELARVVGNERRALETNGTPAFIINEHYGFASQITFYLPEAKRRVPDDPLVFVYGSAVPRNQFYFWPGYEKRIGQNAIYVREIDRPQLVPGWFSKWWHHDANIFKLNHFYVDSLPDEVVKQFDSVAYMGVRNITLADNSVVRRVQLFECKNLK